MQPRTIWCAPCDALQPTTSMLFEHHPALTCTLLGAQWFIDNGGAQAEGGNGYSIILDCFAGLGTGSLSVSREPAPSWVPRADPGGKPGCGSLPDPSKQFPVRQLVTNTGWGTGNDIRINPGIGFPGWANYFPVTRAVPEPPSVRNLEGPAPAPVPYPGGPPYGAPQYAAGWQPVVSRPASGPTAGRAARTGTDAGIRGIRGAVPDGNAADPAAGSHPPSDRSVIAVNVTIGGRPVAPDDLLDCLPVGVCSPWWRCSHRRDSSPSRAYRALVQQRRRTQEWRLRQDRRCRGRQGRSAHDRPGQSWSDVEFEVDDSVQLTQSSRAVIRFDNLYGDRYLALEAGAGGGAPLKPGDTIAAANTAPALDLDTLIGGFRPLFRALDPDQINALSGQLIQAFQGQGRTISSLLGQTATFTDALADRDALIGDLINNLDLVLGAIGDNDADFGKALGQLDELTAALAARKDGIADATANIDTTAREVADLLAQSRPAIQRCDRRPIGRRPSCSTNTTTSTTC